FLTITTSSRMSAARGGADAVDAGACARVETGAATRARPMATVLRRPVPPGERISVTLRDLIEHHLGCAAADREHPGVAPEPLDRGAAHVAHAAVELLAARDDLVDELAGQRLQHRDLLHHV